MTPRELRAAARGYIQSKGGGRKAAAGGAMTREEADAMFADLRARGLVE